MLGVSNRFSILIDSADYRQVTSRNDLDFAQMVEGQRPTALYLQVPASATEDLKPLTSVLIMQMMNYLTKRAEQEPSGRLPRPFVFYLDELANAGRIPDIEKHITLVRGAGMAVIGALQDFGQSERVYGPEITTTFLSNFTTQITLPGSGQNEAEYYSRRLGFFTEKTISTSATTQGGSILPTSTAKTVSEVQRSLLQPDEIRTMPVGSFLMVSDNAPPIRGTFKTYLERPELLALTQLRVRRRVQVSEVQVQVQEESRRAALGRPTQEQKPAAGPAMTPPPETLL
jgi:type IV secretion system protein VirD4